MPHVLKLLFDDLTVKGETFLRLSDSTIIPAKLFHSPRCPHVVRDFDIPMLVCDRMALSNIPWDIALVHILPKIDNVSSVRMIATEADMEIDYVRSAFRILLFYECIIMTDLFRFSNRYAVVAENIHVLLHPNNETLREIDAFSYIDRGEQFVGNHKNSASFGLDISDAEMTDQLSSAEGEDAETSNTLTEQASLNARLSNLARLLLSFNIGVSVGDIFKSCLLEQESPTFGKGKDFLLQGIRNHDLKRLLAIAQHKRVITRVHEYPAYVHMPSNSAENGESVLDDYESPAVQLREIIEHLDGSRCLDDISCELEIQPSVITSYPGICITYK